MISVFIATRIKLYREGLALALQHAWGLHIAGTAAGPLEFGPELATHPHPVLLLDVATAAGLAALAQTRAAYPGLRVVALGVTESTSEILMCAEAGASGYVTRDASISELVTAIKGAACDELACPPQIASALMRRVARLAAERRQKPVTDRLSSREVEVAMLIARGLSNKQIATQLCITVATVKNHVHNILDKLDVKGRSEAAAWIRAQQGADYDGTLVTFGHVPRSGQRVPAHARSNQGRPA
jgi:two-component system, NarL family, nitrate/nitrite response regulator NarL